MTRKLSITTAVAVAALSIGAPAAFGEGRLAGSIDEATAVSPDWFERAATRAQLSQNVSIYRDAHERGAAVMTPSQRAELLRSEGLNKLYGLGEFAPPTSNVTEYRDSVERGSVLGGGGIASTLAGYQDAFARAAAYGRARSSTVANYKDAFERSVPPRGTVPVSAPSSGTEIEWPQVGVGLGIGILLALGLGLIMRMVRVRPVAH